MKTVFLTAETTASRFEQVTGLVEGLGFVAHGPRDLPGGLYPESMAARIGAALGADGINFYPTPALTVNEGRRKLAASLS